MQLSPDRIPMMKKDSSRSSHEPPKQLNGIIENTMPDMLLLSIPLKKKLQHVSRDGANGNYSEFGELKRRQPFNHAGNSSA